MHDEATLRIRVANEPRTRGIRFLLGLLLAERGEHGEARELFADEAILSPQDVNTRYYLARSQAECGDIEAAAQLLAGIDLRRVTAPANDLSFKGDIFRRLAQPSAARDAYLEAIRADRMSLISHRRLSLLSHNMMLAMDRPAGFAPPERSEWVSYEGFHIPELDDDGRVIGLIKAPSASWFRLFRKKIVVVTWGFECKGTGPSLLAEKLAVMMLKRWSLPRDFIWISLSEYGVREWMDFSRVTFAPQQAEGKLGEPTWHPMSIDEVEELTGYRFVWGRP